MDRSVGVVDRWSKGDPLTKGSLNRTVDTLNTLIDGVAGVNQVRAGPERGSRTARYQVVSVAGDYIVGRRLDMDSTVYTVLVAIAKPYLLRNSITARAGITYTYAGIDERTADDGATTEDQVVVPSWAVDDEILAEAGVTGGTGVVLGTVPDDYALLWIARSDGRAWAKVAEAPP